MASINPAVPVATVIRPIDAVDGRQNAEKIRTLAEGKTIGAEVITSKNGEVTLKTVDGITISAKLTDGGQLSNGDSVVLNVTQNSNAPVSLKLVSVNGQDVTPTATSIMSLVLSDSPAGSSITAQLAAAMSSMGLPVTANALNTAQLALSRFPGLDIQLAAFMAAQDIPITEENIQTVRAWTAQSPQAAEVIEQFAAAQAQNTTAQASAEAQNTQNAHAVNAQSAQASSALPEGFSAKQEIASFTAALPKSAGEAVKNSPEALKALEQAFTQAARGEQPNKSAAAAELSKLPEMAQSKTYTTFALDRAISLVAQKYGEAFKNSSGRLDTNALFAVLKQNSDNTAQLKRAVNELPEFLTKLVKQAAEGEGAARQTAPAAQQLLQQSRLGTDMSQMIYAQTPFRYEDRENSAELYVMKRNPGKAPIDAQNVTVLVSLQTDNIGTVDSIVRIERGFMNLELRVDDEKIKRRVTSELGTLKELIEDTQYVLHNVSVNVSKEKLNASNAAAFARSGAALPSAGVDILA